MTNTSSATTVSSLITPLTFTGQSKYAASFQQILTKAVQTDSIQLASLLDRQNENQTQQSTLQSLDQVFGNLQAAITQLTNATGPASLAGGSSNPSVASVSVGTGANAGSYQLEVNDLGAATQSVSAAGATPVTDPNSQNIGSGNSFTITIADPSVNGGQPTTVTVNATPPNLAGLVQTINTVPSLGASASIVNVGSRYAPDYRLALQSTNLGNVSLSVTDSSSNELMATTSTGRNSSYKVDGYTISGNSDVVDLAPGVTANLVSASAGNPVTINVSQSSANAQKALQDFATAYNGVVDALATQHGQTNGALSGDSILITSQQVLSKITAYTSNGSGLSDVGLDLDRQGHLSFNTSEFNRSIGSNFALLAQFLGDSNSGFAQAAGKAVDSLEDPINGSLKNAESILSKTSISLRSKINDQVAQVNLFQENLYKQLAKSDAATYSLSAQAEFFTQLFQTQTANRNGGL